MIRTCTDVVGRVYEHEGEVDSLLDEVERARPVKADTVGVLS
jgi:hypothetical protein